MKILVSAFACSPLWGSEPSVGWNWARELAAAHEVTVLTHEYFRAHMEAHSLALPEDLNGLRIQFEYLAVPPRRGAFHEQLLNSQTYYLRWQHAARVQVKALLARQSFDLMHHVTWGNFRWPVPLYGLAVPLVVGPLGGGERAPATLYRELPWRFRLKEALRDLIIWSGAHDPWVARGLADAQWILCRTPETAAALPASARARALIAHDIGAPPALSVAEVQHDGSTGKGELRCLFVGRLLAWKGAHFALRALAELRRRGVKASLTLVGTGPLLAYLKSLALQLGLQNCITWRDSLPRAEVMQLYRQHDVFLFPSLHDSGGTVVLESLSRGCPVICVDLGGPPHFVTTDCGGVARAADGQADALPGRLADLLEKLAADPVLRISLRAGALRTAACHRWDRRVSAAYAPILSSLAERGPQAQRPIGLGPVHT